MSPITMHDVDSSNLKRIGHDGEKTLVVEFHNGTSYKYTGVPADVLDQVRFGVSAGQAFNRLVKKPGYAYERVS